MVKTFEGEELGPSDGRIRVRLTVTRLVNVPPLCPCLLLVVLVKELWTSMAAGQWQNE